MDPLSDLERLFAKAVEAVCERQVGVVFSAGVDSTLAAYVASKFSKVTAYVVGVEGSEDLKYARMLAPVAPFQIRYTVLDAATIEATVPKVLSAVKKPNPVDVGVGMPMHFASEAAKADGLKVMLCGQGGDELFGGYWRYLKCLVERGPEATVAWMEKDWLNADADNLDRDRAVTASNGVELRFPYLDSDFSGYVRRMPFDMKIREDGNLTCDEISGRKFVRKYALKKLAIRMGVPDYIADRPKKAAQYGSGVHKLLGTVARSKGYKLGSLRLYLEDLLAEP
ncbi:MAG: asparagine synthase C-terminal domain-containing protein [Candidatus Altiarchaeota archaeon]